MKKTLPIAAGHGARPSKLPKRSFGHDISSELSELNLSKFQCDICKKHFTRSTGLQNHMLIHLDLKPVSCSYNCGKTFRVKSDCQNHEATVHRHQRKHVCYSCGAAFAKPFALKRHVKSKVCQSEEEPYTEVSPFTMSSVGKPIEDLPLMSSGHHRESLSTKVAPHELHENGLATMSTRMGTPWDESMTFPIPAMNRQARVRLFAESSEQYDKPLLPSPAASRPLIRKRPASHLPTPSVTEQLSLCSFAKRQFGASHASISVSGVFSSSGSLFGHLKLQTWSDMLDAPIGVAGNNNGTDNAALPSTHAHISSECIAEAISDLQISDLVQIMRAAELDDHDSIKDLLNAGHVRPGTWNFDGTLTALHVAVSHGTIRTMGQLLAFDATQVDTPGSCAIDTPLLLACKKRRVEHAEALVKAGADVFHKGLGGWTPLHLAVEHDPDGRLTSFLLGNGRSAEQAYTSGQLEDESDYETMIHFAARQGTLASLGAVLLGALGQSLRGRERRAIIASRLALKDSAGRTCLHHAAMSLGHDQVDYLLKWGLGDADETGVTETQKQELVKELDDRGRTPLHYACEALRHERGRSRKTTCETIRLLRFSGLCIDLADDDGNTPLQHMLTAILRRDRYFVNRDRFEACLVLLGILIPFTIIGRGYGER